MSFGDNVKELRIAQKKTLRQFCSDHGYDPSNWSKIERGIISPPKDGSTLERWAQNLGIERNSQHWQDFMDQAAIARGNIPSDILNEKTLLEKMPVFFRTVRGAELNEGELNNLIAKIKEAHTPDDNRH